MRINDDEVINDIREGRNISKNYFYANNIDFFINFVKMHGGNAEDAKDCFQDAMVIMIENIRVGRFEHSSSLSTYVTGIAKNIFFKKISRQKEFTVGETFWEPLIDDTEILSESEIQKKVSIARECYEALTESARMIINMIFIQRISQKLVADKLGLKNEDTVKTRKFKIMQNLQDCFSSKYKQNDN